MNFKEFLNLKTPGGTVESNMAKMPSNGTRIEGSVTSSGGIQLEDWSPADQERIKRGERPLGRPIHRNI